MDKNQTIYEPPEYLFEKIVKRIERESRLARLRRKVALFSLSLACCFGAIIPGVKAAGSLNTGSLEFLRLLFSDFEIVIASWQDFLMLILQSLPIAGLLVISLSLVALMTSLKIMVKTAKEINFKKHESLIRI